MYNLITEKEKELIRKEIIKEKECGHLLCSFEDEDYENDMILIAQVLNKDWRYVDIETNGDILEDVLQIEDVDLVDEALSYYYELHA